MSIINDALKKAEQNKPGHSILKPGAKEFLHPELSKKKQKMNWGPIFVVLVLVLITGPLLAPIFSSPFRNTNARYYQVPTYQDALSSGTANPISAEAYAENRKGQFGMEEAALSRAASAGMMMAQPNFNITGIVCSSPDSYCLINGKVVKLGGEVEGAKLVAVQPDKATLELNGKKIDLWVNQ